MAQEADPAERGPARRPVVLLVEDEPWLRSTTAEFLQLSGYAVIEAADTSEAIAELEFGLSIDVVFSDVCTPGTRNGLALASWVRQHYPRVPVILTSGHGEPVRQSAIDLVGGGHFLPKPYHLEELANRLRALGL